MNSSKQGFLVTDPVNHNIAEDEIILPWWKCLVISLDVLNVAQSDATMTMLNFSV